jgi:hypothetical protein
MEESFRQALGAVFIAVLDAVAPGDDEVYSRACQTLQRAVDAGMIDDPFACWSLKTLAATADSVEA